MFTFYRRVISLLNRKIKVLIEIKNVLQSIHRLHKKNKNAIIFIATPIYGNWGDYAIVLSQIKLVSDNGFGECIVEVSSKQYATFKKIIKMFVKPNDVIIIDGGGNMGTLWINEEYKMREIVKTYSNNPIIIFPQTAYFDNSEEGNRELSESINVYNSHDNLTIFCRDTNTYKLISTKMSMVKSFYVPDIVLYNNYSGNTLNRDGILVCLRDDLERINDINIYECIENEFVNKKISNSSTMFSGEINRYNREELVMSKLTEFSSAELVITDRLHGMLFSAITGTPCIAVDNKSHKVKQGYEWIQDLPYIIFCENESDVEKGLNIIKKFNGKNFYYTSDKLISYYKLIMEEVKRAAL